MKSLKKKIKKVFAVGNEYWVEGHWICSAEIYLHYDASQQKYIASVGYGSNNSTSIEFIRSVAKCINDACNYADKLNQKNLTPEIVNVIRTEWDREKITFLKGLYKEWNSDNKY